MVTPDADAFFPSFQEIPDYDNLLGRLKRMAQDRFEKKGEGEGKKAPEDAFGERPSANPGSSNVSSLEERMKARQAEREDQNEQRRVQQVLLYLNPEPLTLNPETLIP